jgi:cytochrome P450
MFGGIETTEAMITNALLHLLSNPAELELVRADWSLLPRANRGHFTSAGK